MLRLEKATDPVVEEDVHSSAATESDEGSDQEQSNDPSSGEQPDFNPVQEALSTLLGDFVGDRVLTTDDLKFGGLDTLVDGEEIRRKIERWVEVCGGSRKWIEQV